MLSQENDRLMLAYEVLYYCNNVGEIVAGRVFGELVSEIPESKTLHYKIKGKIE